MRILQASGELHPYSKTGGLADMVAALSKSLAAAGHHVTVITPMYRGICDRFQYLEPLDWHFEEWLGGRLVSAAVWRARPVPRLDVLFVDQPEFFERPELYQEGGIEYRDNPERFTFLSKCVVSWVQRARRRPDVVHVHDWHVGLVPLLLRDWARQNGGHARPRTCLTIHNLAYQGCYPPDRYSLTGLPWGYFHSDAVEFYGSMNFLKAGIAFADAITTVSPRYAREILTPEFGCGLDGMLGSRRHLLTGILNGVDYDEWKTTGNPHLSHAYSRQNLEGKTSNKLDLQRSLGLVQRIDTPLFGSVTRLVDQKGVDLMADAVEAHIGSGMQFVMLGSGQPVFEAVFTHLAQRHPSQAAVRIGYDHSLSHRIEAGCDFFLMPSRFEPCGLNQMYSQRYGTIPIVRATGGLDDSVVDIRENPAKADGIKFHECSSAALTKAMQKAMTLFQDPDMLPFYRRNAMAADFSWHKTAAKYLDVYKRM